MVALPFACPCLHGFDPAFLAVLENVQRCSALWSAVPSLPPLFATELLYLLSLPETGQTPPQAKCYNNFVFFLSYFF